MMEDFHSGTRDPIRQTHPTTSPRSGQIPGFFQKFRQTTQTHTIRIPKTTRFQQVENLRVRQTRTTPPVEGSDSPGHAGTGG